MMSGNSWYYWVLLS